MTLCVNCGFDNPSGMRFCGNCGTRLGETTAPATLPPILVTQAAAPAVLEIKPESLGVMMGADLIERMKRAGLEAAGQRRNVSVIFTDLSGYTELSERMDEEDIFDIIQQYIRLLMNCVYKYEGIVDKLTGDGLMALFGAPIAHENSAERAVLAALDMQTDVNQFSKELEKKFGCQLAMRVGLNAGSVVVGGIGSNLLMNYTAIGDTVNLASRIEEAAEPGTTLVSEHVFQQTRRLFDYQQMPTQQFKGIANPVTVYRVIGPKEKPELLRGIEGLSAPMIGREKELDLLKKAFQACLTQNQGQFVLVTGEAGLGKSRLTREFKASLGEHPILVLEGHSLSYRRSVPYWIFKDLLHSYLGVSLTAPQSQVRERLMEKITQALGNQAIEVLPYFEYLLSLPYSDPTTAERLHYFETGQLRQQIFFSLRNLLLSETTTRPLLLVLEDLHWADETSLELLRFLIESLRQVPLFILGIARFVTDGMLSKIVDRAQSQLGNRFLRIEVQNLSIDQSQQLLSELLAISDLPVRLREHIVQRATGIPFYLEEILRMLIDQGAIQRHAQKWRIVPGTDTFSLGVPDTLQELILTRYDQLNAAQRRVLQGASVIGKDFSLPVLNGILEPASSGDVQDILENLVTREFLARLPGGQDTDYTFRHILMSDAIYGTLLRREQSKLHGQVGNAIETIYADRLEGQIEILATHYRWSPQLDRALHYLILAGQKAVSNNANEQARQHYEAALELLPKVLHLPYQEMQVYMGMGDALMFFGDYPEARQHYQTALQAISSQEPGQFVEEQSALLRKIAKTCERQGEYDQALFHLAEAQAILENVTTPNPVELAQVWNDIGWIHFRRGIFSEAQQLLQKALQLVESSDAYETIASIYNRLGGVAYNQGDLDRAAGFLRKSIAIRESLRDMVGLATSFNNLGLLETEMGDFDNALENLTRSYELKTRLGQAEGIAMALNSLGWLRIQRGELTQAEETINEALELARQIGYSSLLWQVQKTFGDLYLASEQWEKSQEVLSETIPVLIENNVQDELIDTYRMLGVAALGKGDIAAAQDWLQNAEEVIHPPTDMADSLSPVQHGELWLFRSRLAIQKGEWELAAKAIRESEAIFQNMRSHLYQGRVAYIHGLLCEAMGDRRSAKLHFREAVLLFQSVGARLEEKRAQEAYLMR